MEYEDKHKLILKKLNLYGKSMADKHIVSLFFLDFLQTLPTTSIFL